MPNYLERVVAAGARTAALARPPVAAPLRLPGFGQLWSLASEAVEFAAQLSVPSGAGEEPPSPEASVPGAPAPLPAFQEEARATPRGVGQPAPTLSAAPALRVERATPAPGALEVNTVIQAPPSLRPALPPAAALAVPPPPATVSAPLSPSREASAAPRLSQVQGRGEVDRQRVAPGYTVADAVQMPRIGESVPSAADIARPRQTATTAGASATVEVDYSLRSDAQRLPGQVTPPLDVGPVPIRPAPSASLPTAPMGRQSRITIGRIDVQVNNHPPALTSSPPPPMTHAFLPHGLETRFLNRFPMRP